jgi:DNA primase
MTMADLVEDIKSRLDVLSLISQYVQLKRTGRSYKALSPFKAEKTPSFVVSPEKQIWHDFSTGKGGDIFTFVQEFEGVDFSEALKILADKAGLDVDAYRSGPKISKETKSEKEECFRAHELATEFFHKNLCEDNEGAPVLKYLHDRGIKDDTIKLFKIGFAKDSFESLTDYLISKGISKNMLLKSGLVSSKTTNADRVFDKFRGRLMFPIHDIFGRVCGFGGRALLQDQSPKYLNSPDSVIYNKSKTLFGLYFSKNEIKKSDKAIFVEGYFDMIMPFQEGIKNVIATSGTALTGEHIKLVSRYTKNVITAFDFDDAGFNATTRAFELLLSQAMNMRCLPQMKGKDPADFVLSDASGFISELENSKPFLDFLIEKTILKIGIESFDKKKQVMSVFLPYLKQISPIERDYYIRKLSLVLGFTEQVLYDEVQSYYLTNENAFRVASGIQDISEKSASSFDNSEVLFSLILEYPFLFGFLKDKNLEKLLSEEFKSVYKVLDTQYNANRDLDKWDFSDLEAESLKKRLSLLALYGEEKYGNFSKEVLKDEVFKVLSTLKKDFQKNRLKELQKEIANAEAQNNTEKLLELLKEQTDILSKE